MCIVAAVLGTSVNGRTSYISVGRGMISMMVMVTMAIAKDWFSINKKTALMGCWGIGMVMPMLFLAVMYFGNGLHRYKNIYPRNMKIPGSRIRMVIVKDR